MVVTDDKNTDNSAEVVKRHLGHIPGEIVIVKFDGMGPTLTQLVEIGIKNYPNATHGIISDADFTPITRHLDKWELNTECSKHMYMIRSPGSSGNVRNMDWIYRNLPGARVERRVRIFYFSVALPLYPYLKSLPQRPHFWLSPTNTGVHTVRRRIRASRPRRFPGRRCSRP